MNETPAGTGASNRHTHRNCDMAGTRVKAKSGLNHFILASGRGPLERKPNYKAGKLVKVDPTYTSQTVCACRTCGLQAHADHSEAINILVRADLPPRAGSARGTGASARQGSFPSGIPTTREPHARTGRPPPVQQCI